MIVNTNISQIVNNIKDYTFEIIDKESDKNLYTTISRVYRIEKNINTIIKEDRIENIDIDCLYLANYVLNIEQAYQVGLITQFYAKKLEESIYKNPENYLWSHRRWKRKYKDEYKRRWIGNLS